MEPQTPAPPNRPEAPLQPAAVPLNNSNENYVLAVSGYGLFGKDFLVNKFSNKPVALVLFASGKIIAINGDGDVTEEFMSNTVSTGETRHGSFGITGIKLQANGQQRAFVSEGFMRGAKDAHKILAKKHPEYQFSAVCDVDVLFFSIVEAFNKDPVKYTQDIQKIKPEDIEPEKGNVSNIYKDTGLDLTVFGTLFPPEKKSRSMAIAIIGVPILLLLALMFFATSNDTSDLSDAKVYDLQVKSTRVDAGFRESTNLLIYTTPPPDVNCENVVVQVPLKVYPNEAARPQAGSNLRVYIAPDAQCTSNGLFIVGQTEKTTTENAMDSIVNVMLIGMSLYGAAVLIFGAIYSSNKKVREFYITHRFISKILGVLFFGWLIAGYALRFFDLSALGIGFFAIPVAIGALIFFLSRRK